MDLLQTIRKIWEHIFWADARLLEAIRASGAPPEALREYVHIIGAEEVWLSRLERRAPRSAVWPEGSMAEAPALQEQVEAGYRAYLTGLGAADLSEPVTYINSAGTRFASEVGDILVHVALHGQYHRGKVNLLLRQASHAPAPADYIAFVRGAR
jgi:uncharacterized damage-inducible protein DinB